MIKRTPQKLKILFLDILTGDKDLRKTIDTKIYRGGTYPETMRRAFGLKKSVWFSIDASRGKFPINLSDFDVIVIGGSTEDPVKGYEKAWMKEVYKIIRETVRRHIPILGICGGLQFVIRALGGEVIFNPRGREFGSMKVTLTQFGQHDPLFRGIPRTSFFQSSHKCMAKKILTGWELLASSDLCKIQAIAIGDNIRLVQFHLELTQKQLKAIALLRKKALIQEGFIKNDAGFNSFIDSIKNTEINGKKVLRNFIHYVVLPNKAHR